METKEELDDLTKAQAEAWCRMVAELMVDFSLDSSEPGKVALEQVQHFLRRKLKPVSGAASSEPQEWELLSDGPNDFCSIIREAKTKKTIACNVQGASGTLIVSAHRVALAAERDKRADWNYVIEELENKLLAAQAAIAHANRVNKRTAIIEADLSALEQHDAEVRKPLVDALEKISDFKGKSPYDLAGIANTALAQVKEGK